MKTTAFFIKAFMLGWLFLCSIGCAETLHDIQNARTLERVEEEIIRRIASEQFVGISVAVIEPEATSYYNYGTTHFGGNSVPQETSVYEIGSISKVFTALILADLCETSEMDYHDPLIKYLPLGTTAPGNVHEKISLLHLATHTSGLPRMPDNFMPADFQNPYVDYTEDQLLEFLSRYSLKRQIGTKVEYSNYGMGLLGFLLSSSQNKAYRFLLRDHITQPLGMIDTVTHFEGSLVDRLVPGHSNSQPVANWDFDVLVGAGGIRSTSRDMARFIAANMGLQQTSLRSAIKASHIAQKNYESGKMKVALGWHIRPHPKGDVIWHNGGTGGYRSFAGFRHDGKRGVVILGNTDRSVDDLGLFLLNEAFTFTRSRLSAAVELGKSIDAGDLTGADAKFRQIWQAERDRFEFDEQQFNRLGYRYLEQGKIDAAICVFRLNTLFFPESSNTWESLGTGYKNCQQTDDAIGAYRTALKVYPGNESAKAALVSMGIKDIEVDVSVDETTLINYCGDYELTPDMLMTITYENGQLVERTTGQQQFSLGAISSTRFYLKGVEAQIEFFKDNTGKVSHLVVFQAGQEIHGKKRK